MKTAFEAFVSVFIITIALLLCASVIAADLNTAHARDAYMEYCSKMQDSNFSEIVVNECIYEATLKGYSLHVSVYTDDNGNRSADVILTYDYTIASFDIEKNKTIQGHIS